MNKRQAKKEKRKKDLFYDTEQKCYRDARKSIKYYEMMRKIASKCKQPDEEFPNYWGEY